LVILGEEKAMINLDYPEILDLFTEHLAPGRAESEVAPILRTG